MTYRASAHPVYGASCAGSILGDNRGVLCNEPHLVSEFYTVSLTGGRTNAVTFLLAAFVQANLPLLSAGSAACRVLIAPPASDASGLLISSAAGNAAVTFRIPSEIGDLNYLWQWFQFDANAIWSSDGLRTTIR